MLRFGGTGGLTNKPCLKSFPRKEYFLDLPSSKFFKKVPLISTQENNTFSDKY